MITNYIKIYARKSRLFIIIIIFCFIVCLSSCSSNNFESEVYNNNIYVVPTSINRRVNSINTEIDFYIVSDKKIDGINNLSFKIDTKSEGNYESTEVSEFKFIEEYKDYYNYLIKTNIFDISGDINLTEINFSTTENLKVNGDIDVSLKSYDPNSAQIYPGSDYITLMNFSFRDTGCQFLLSSEKNVKITKIYYMNDTSFNLTNYIDEIKINQLLFDKPIDIVKSEDFYLDISFKDDIPEDSYYIEQLMFDYVDEDNNEEQGYILGPYYMSAYLLIAENYIDSL